jgi:hypothetical protein
VRLDAGWRCGVRRGITGMPVTPPALFSDGARPNEDQFFLAVPVIGMAAGLLAFALAHRRTRREGVAPAEVTVRTASLAIQEEPERPCGGG